jgi:hypothetical protein
MAFLYESPFPDLDFHLLAMARRGEPSNYL